MKDLGEVQKILETEGVSLYQVGSRVLPWITNAHDTDYCFYMDGPCEAKLAAKIFQYRESKECFFIRPIRTIPNSRIYSYIEWYKKPLFGKEVPMYNLFEHIDEYKQCLIDYNSGKGYEPDRKSWYHVLTGIYMLENGDYHLTDEQTANVQLCHDRQMTHEIYDFIQEKLNEYRIELGCDDTELPNQVSDQ